MPYKHLTQEDRIQLGALIRAGHTQKFTAGQLGVHPATISRELLRNKSPGRAYHARVAKELVRRRRYLANQRCRRIEHDTRLQKYIHLKLQLYWSPEQIAGRWKRLHPEEIICHETIYKFVYNNPELKPKLRLKATKYRKRHGSIRRARLREAMKKRWIDDRPDIVAQRSRLGDWEGDTVEGKRGSGTILTHVDRKSGYLLADKIKGKSPYEVRDKTILHFNHLPKRKRCTITYDNGTEFTFHELIERGTNAIVYFAHPYSSWERGTNENTNGLLRQFLPRSLSFQEVTQTYVDRAARLLNSRPRKRLRYLTPAEVFYEKNCTKD